MSFRRQWILVDVAPKHETRDGLLRYGSRCNRTAFSIIFPLSIAIFIIIAIAIYKRSKMNFSAVQYRESESVSRSSVWTSLGAAPIQTVSFLVLMLEIEPPFFLSQLKREREIFFHLNKILFDLFHRRESGTIVLNSWGA